MDHQCRLIHPHFSPAFYELLLQLTKTGASDVSLSWDPGLMTLLFYSYQVAGTAFWVRTDICWNRWGQNVQKIKTKQPLSKFIGKEFQGLCSSQGSCCFCEKSHGSCCDGPEWYNEKDGVQVCCLQNWLGVNHVDSIKHASIEDLLGFRIQVVTF